MIRFAEKGDREALKRLWAEVFGDSPEAVDFYFEHRHSDEGMLVYEADGEIGGMLSILPMTLASGDAQLPGGYIYAVATAPAHRSRGIATQLLYAAHDWMRARGYAAAVLVPASPGLFDYYAKRGYRAAFYLDIRTHRADALPRFPEGGAYAPCDAQTYARIRDAAFASSALYARWDARAVSYAARTLEPVGGVLRLALGAGEGCAAWERETAGGVHVRELALRGIEVSDALAILHRALGAPHYRVRHQAGEGATPFGMITWLAPAPKWAGGAPYLGLALD
ncbi:MAG: GNAT family N-acetyltransferase [Christensenellales bacterium]|jgi:predicted N-acetyltransferase YhbS